MDRDVNDMFGWELLIIETGLWLYGGLFDSTVFDFFFYVFEISCNKIKFLVKIWVRAPRGRDRQPHRKHQEVVLERKAAAVGIACRETGLTARESLASVEGL